ncbi:MAG: VanZ family protein [Prevotellaceae bacterium]|jgi:VanZ family protein|nr:VanZ family protein [Prevotellaceae bacterium]
MALKLLKYHWRAVIWLSVILFGCLSPEKESSEPNNWLSLMLSKLSSMFAKIPHYDKVAHFILYFVFTLLLMSGFLRQYGVKSLRAYGYTFFIPLFTGIVIELVQDRIGRSCSIYDVCANTVGIVVALMLFNPLKWMLRNIL